MKLDFVVATKRPAILQLIDGFSGEPLEDAPVIFQLDQAPCEPIRKGNGFYIFTDLLDTSPHQLDVTCAGFVDAQTTLTVIPLPLDRALAELIVVLKLGPSPSYSYPVGATLLRGQVTSRGEPVADAEVFAAFHDRQGTWHWCKTKTCGTERDSAYFGQYALALPLAAASAEVNLRFTKDGHASHFERVAPIRSQTTIIGASLQPANA
jgi:hypothetical protein